MSERRRVLVGVVGVLLVLAVISGGFVTGALITDYDNLGTLTRVISLVQKHYLETAEPADMIDGAIKGVVDSLGDPYSIYMPPKMYQELTEQVRGSFGGIGILVGQNEEHIVVVKPIKDTPAYNEGLKAGDIIFKIDGKDTKDMDMDSAVNMMRGPVGTEVKLTVYRKSDNKMHDFIISREIIRVPTVEGEILQDTDIAYVSIVQFSLNTAVELQKTLSDLGVSIKEQNSGKVKGIILDLRGNPGGELEAAVKVADMFVPEGPIVYITYRSAEEETYEADNRYLNLPLVVLVDGNSASASEIVAGAIKDTQAGTLVGTKTFGKGVVQSLYELQNNAGLKLTTGKYLTPNRNDINKKGIEPHIEMEQAEDVETDVQLEKAIQIIEQKTK
ncbi:S41 family peptidase [Phosphitispora sp. TUW77]|uniref:S41 family peptidase n=1 Tax=Phosphitispora sp. TUW77 TaxID=3152361 RepID=UPI003AB67C60